MRKNMLSWLKLDKDRAKAWWKGRRDKILGCYVIPILLPVALGLFALILFLASRYKKAEIFFQRVLRKLQKN